MNTKTTSIMLTAALFLTLSPSHAVETTPAPNGDTVTKIKVNGLFAAVLLSDGADTNGFLNATKDRNANTTALDFSYVIPHPDPDYVFLDQGAGEIPNSAFTISPTAAHLAVTTPFPTTRCLVNVITSTFVCGPGSPKTFNLDWEVNGFIIVHEKTKREEVFGPALHEVQGRVQPTVGGREWRV